MSSAYLNVIQGRCVEADLSLEKLQTGAEKAGRNGNLIEILLLRTLANRSLGNVAVATLLLSEALTLAEPEGYIRIFVDLGLPIASVLREAASQAAAHDYVRRLLKAFENRVTNSPALAYQPLVEPLSTRELEILRLIAKDLSNREIAQKLVLTVGTVKSHAHNIYGKLGVSSRIRAANRARDLNLL